MRKSADIRAQLATKQAEVAAIVELATEEKRELTADEKAVVDRIQGIGDEPGELKALATDLERAVRFEARIKDIAADLGGKLGKPQERRSVKAVVVPARARVHGNLQAFTGAKAEENAYVFGRVLAAGLFNHAKSRQWLKDHGMRNALSTDSNERGGLFVPTETSREIIRLVEEYGVFRRFAKNEPMGSNAKTVPVRTGGMTAYPVAETNTANEGSNSGTKSEPAWTNVELVARKWKAWLKMSDEINEDSLVSIADQIVVECAQAFAYAEDNAGWNGDGTSTYHSITGVLNAVAAGSIYTAATGNTAFETLDTLDFIKMKGQLPRYPGIRPAWFISPEGYGSSIERLLLAAGGNAVADLANGGVPMFLGSPVILTNVLNATLDAQVSTKILAYGDLRMAALFGDRRKMTMSLTDQRYWEEDQIAVKATERIDINVHSKGTASTAGAILVMQTPAS
jgi:HK97 family phage major capsid protein